MDDVKAKQQVVEKIKDSTSILVTVSNDPSVDALSAALGLTLLLDKLEKHPTAIFSGAVPPAISFLEPEKTFDSTTDSLRDFIIALDKEKADHLRYKVEGDSVKIFITPYRTTITQDDLQFSQGDYNVELVIALGVDNQDHLDDALETHGQIFHDAAIVTVTAGTQSSTLGGIDWHDDQASSLSEMIAGLAEAMKSDKSKSLVDPSIATALLTGIVAQTDRFSNDHTTSRVMTVAAKLMGIGADQQLIARKLEENHEIPERQTSLKREEPKGDDPTTFDVHGDDESTDDGEGNDDADAPVVNISLQPNETLEQLDKRVKEAEQAEAAKAAGEALEEVTEAAPADASHGYAIESETRADEAAEPTLGGTLNATTEQAAEDARQQAENDQNKTILTHSYLGGAASDSSPQPQDTPSFLSSAPAPGSTSVNDMPAPAANDLVHSAYAVSDDHQQPVSEPTFEPVQPVAPVTPPVTPPTPPAPTDLGLPLPPPVPDFSQLPPSAFPPSLEEPQPERLGDILAPETPAVPPVAPPPTIPAPAAEAPFPPQPPAAPNDPGQFKIPGQQ
jgi:hypothetical protein